MQHACQRSPCFSWAHRLPAQWHRRQRRPALRQAAAADGTNPAVSPGTASWQPSPAAAADPILQQELLQFAADQKGEAQATRSSLRSMIQTLIHAQDLLRRAPLTQRGSRVSSRQQGPAGIVDQHELDATRAKLHRALSALTQLQAATQLQRELIMRLQKQLLLLQQQLRQQQQGADAAEPSAAAAATAAATATASAAVSMRLAMVAGAGAASSRLHQHHQQQLQAQVAAASNVEQQLHSELAAARAQISETAAELRAASTQQLEAQKHRAAVEERLGSLQVQLAAQAQELSAAEEVVNQMRWELLAKQAALAAQTQQAADAREAASKAVAAQADLLRQKDAAISSLLEKIMLLEASAVAEAAWTQQQSQQQSQQPQQLQERQQQEEESQRGGTDEEVAAGTVAALRRVLLHSLMHQLAGLKSGEHSSTAAACTEQQMQAQARKLQLATKLLLEKHQDLLLAAIDAPAAPAAAATERTRSPDSSNSQRSTVAAAPDSASNLQAAQQDLQEARAQLQALQAALAGSEGRRAATEQALRELSTALQQSHLRGTSADAASSREAEAAPQLQRLLQQHAAKHATDAAAPSFTGSLVGESRLAASSSSNSSTEEDEAHQQLQINITINTNVQDPSAAAEAAEPAGTLLGAGAPAASVGDQPEASGSTSSCSPAAHTSRNDSNTAATQQLLCSGLGVALLQQLLAAQHKAAALEAAQAKVCRLLGLIGATDNAVRTAEYQGAFLCRRIASVAAWRAVLQQALQLRAEERAAAEMMGILHALEEEHFQQQQQQQLVCAEDTSRLTASEHSSTADLTTSSLLAGPNESEFAAVKGRVGKLLAQLAGRESDLAALQRHTQRLAAVIMAGSGRDLAHLRQAMHKQLQQAERGNLVLRHQLGVLRAAKGKTNEGSTGEAVDGKVAGRLT